MPHTPKPESCASCPLERLGFGFVKPSGPPASKILFIGESPGGKEVETGVPFAGPAGGKLGHILYRLGRDRAQQRVHNLLSCRPPQDKLEGAHYQYDALAHCEPNRRTVLEEGHTVIVALGAVPARELLQLPDAGIKDLHGTVTKVSYGGKVSWVVPTFHPAHLVRGAHNLTGTVTFDLNRAFEIADAGRWEEDQPTLHCDPSPEFFRKWVGEYLQALAADPDHTWLSVDVETPDKEREQDEGELKSVDRSMEIIRINFSYHPDEGLTVPFTEPYISLMRPMMEAGGVQNYWNKAYDLRRLRPIFNLSGHQLDWMDGWKALHSDTPRGLGFVAPFYCLAAGARVRLWDGKSRKISDLVTKREQVELLGCDESGQPIPVKIKNWFRAETAGQRWLEIHTENGLQPIHCTPEHKIWTAGSGWKEAQHLTVTDVVRLPRMGHNSLIHGTLLGDGHLARSGGLSFVHCAAQEAWLRAKAAVFGAVRISYGKAKRGYKPGAPFFRCDIKGVGRWWRKKFYHGRKKYFIPPPDAAALAVWYLDDGTLARTGDSYNPKIFTAGFRRRSSVAWWANKKYGRGRFGRQQVSTYSLGGNSECIAFIGTAAAAFFTEIAPWVHPSMEYKLPPAYRGKYNGWLDRKYFQTGKVLSIAEWAPPKWHRRRNIRYCVEVDHPTHQYFVGGGLVSNSKWGPWKHLSGSNPVLYAAGDSLQTTRCAFGIAADLHAQGMWDVFWRHMHEFGVYATLPSCEVGLKVDRKQLEGWDDPDGTHHPGMREQLGRKSEELFQTMQALVPETLKPLHPKEGWTRRPEGETYDWPLDDAAEMRPRPILEKLEKKPTKVCAACGVKQISVKHRCADKGLTPQVENRITEVPRWYIRLDFNPASPIQVLAYIKASGHTPGREKGKETTNRETIERLSDAKAKNKADAKSRELYHHLLDYRDIKKVLGTYVEGTLRRLAVDREAGINDDRLHATVTNNPSTLRTAMSDPNLQNVVADRRGAESLSSGFRKAVVAEAGCKLVELDWSSIEAVIVGWCMGDPEFIKKSWTGIHDHITAEVVGEYPAAGLPIDELLSALRVVKKKHGEKREQLKRVIHGTNYLFTPYGMAKRFRKLFPSVQIADELQKKYYAAAPKLGPWQQTIQDLAYKQEYLGGAGVHPFDYKHEFYNVRNFSPITDAQAIRYKKIGKAISSMNGRWYEIQLGEDAKRGVAFNPQSIAAGVIRETSLLLFKPGESMRLYGKDWYIGDAYYGRTPLRAIIHDSFLLELPDAMVEAIIKKAAECMTRLITQLPCPEAWGLGEYLQFGVAVKVGVTWAEMQEVRVHQPWLDLLKGTRGEMSVAPEDDAMMDEEDLGDDEFNEPAAAYAY